MTGYYATERGAGREGERLNVLKLKLAEAEL